MSSDEFTFLENILLSQIFGTNFVCMFVVIHVIYYCCFLRPCFVRVLSTVCHVLLLLSSTMLHAGLVMSYIVVSVWRPCFMRVLSTVCHVLLLLSSTMLHAGLVDICHVLLLLSLCGSCRYYMSCTVVIM